MPPLVGQDSAGWASLNSSVFRCEGSVIGPKSGMEPDKQASSTGGPTYIYWLFLLSFIFRFKPPRVDVTESISPKTLSPVSISISDNVRWKMAKYLREKQNHWVLILT
jgi:hypothetical protein